MHNEQAIAGLRRRQDLQLDERYFPCLVVATLSGNDRLLLGSEGSNVSEKCVVVTCNLSCYRIGSEALTSLRTTFFQLWDTVRQAEIT